MSRKVFMAGALLTATACRSEVAEVPTSECASGRKWIGGNSGSSLMHPGRDCIACHAGGEGPRFAVAGTVYPAAGISDPDDCFGIAGASVLVEDAAGRAFALDTNDAGNFYLTHEALEFPLRVELEHDGAMAVMTLQPTVGACASCHIADGAGGALGRIVVP